MVDDESPPPPPNPPTKIDSSSPLYLGPHDQPGDYITAQHKLEPLIVCKCGKCTCDIGKQHVARREGDRLQQFLPDLYSGYYASLRFTLLAQDPLPSLNRAFQSVAQDERVRGLTRSKEEQQSPSLALGFAVRTGIGRGRGINDKQTDKSDVSRPFCDKCKKVGHDISRCWSDKVCNHCKKKGHDESRCYQLHGYPDNFGDGSRGAVLQRDLDAGAAQPVPTNNAAPSHSQHSTPTAADSAGAGDGLRMDSEPSASTSGNAADAALV
ncbi:Gag polyprotein [Bienertia sinuspersici]